MDKRLSPHQGLCAWTSLGAPPQTPVYVRGAARHVPWQLLDPPLTSQAYHFTNSNQFKFCDIFTLLEVHNVFENSMLNVHFS